MPDSPRHRLSLPSRVPGVKARRTLFSALKLPTKGDLLARSAAASAPADPKPPGDDPAAAPGPENGPESTRGLHWRRDRLKRRARRRFRIGAMQAGIVLAALGIGYGLGARHPAPSAPAARANPLPITAPTGAEQQELDAAYALLKSGHPVKAREQFAALVQRHPRWTSLNDDIARAALYAGDAMAFQKLVKQGELSGKISVADGEFLLGQMFMGLGQFDDADRSLGQSAGADPGRAETYYFWGDCLWHWGRPTEAVEKLRAALLRNPYPTADTVYQTKLWLVEVGSGLEATDGSAAQIDQALAAEPPASPALFAAAARAVKAGQWSRSAEGLARARQATDLPTFRVALQDPVFSGERWRPELAAAYAEAFKASPH